MRVVRVVVILLRAFFLPRATLAAEIRALRHQLGVLQRSVKRPRFWQRDRILWVWLTQLWADWVPFALPQCWPFCWWLAVVIDHYSRRAMGFAVFPKRPTSLAIRTFLGRMIARNKQIGRASCRERGLRIVGG